MLEDENGTSSFHHQS